MSYAQPNPYAAPQYPQQYPHPQLGYAIDARMDGDALRTANGTQLPDVCLKCGVRHDLERRHQKFAFVPVWARFFGPLFQVIFMKRSEFYLPICRSCHSNWKKWNLIAGVTWLPFLLFMFLGIAIGDEIGAALSGLGLLGCFAALIVTLILRVKHIVVAKKIDGTHSWLTKIHPAALQAIVGY
jgi:hypothetical protein